MTEKVQIFSNPYDCRWWRPGKSLWKEWDKWRTIFSKDYFCGTFNPMQIYRRSIIKQVLSSIDKNKLEELFATNQVFALEEILYLTLVEQCGGKCRAYPEKNKRLLRHRPSISIGEIKQARLNQDICFVHPVKDNSVCEWISSL